MNKEFEIDKGILFELSELEKGILEKNLPNQDNKFLNNQQLDIPEEYIRIKNKYIKAGYIFVSNFSKKYNLNPIYVMENIPFEVLIADFLIDIYHLNREQEIDEEEMKWLENMEKEIEEQLKQVRNIKSKK